MSGATKAMAVPGVDKVVQVPSGVAVVAANTWAALRGVEDEVLRDHAAHCIEHAISSGNKADQRRKVAELMDVLGRSAR